MLINILNDLNLSALQYLAGQRSIEFFEETFGIDESFYEKHDQKTLLINSIINSNPTGLLLSIETRNYLIDRASHKTLSAIYQQIQGEVTPDLTTHHYDGLKRFCNDPIGLKIFCDALGYDLESEYNVKESASSYSLTPIEPRYGLYDYQVKISDKTFNKIEVGNQSRVVIHLPTGAGKTRTAMHIICRHLMTTEKPLVLWLANSDILCEQASEEFNEAWSYLGNRSILQGKFYKSNEFSIESIKSGFVVGGLQKLHSYYSSTDEKNTLVFDSNITMVVFDEAHMALAETYKNLVQRFMSKSPQAKLIGLTATPGRVYRDERPEVDPQNEALASIFGNNKITMDVSPEEPMEYLIKNGYLAAPEFHDLKYDDIDIYTDQSDKFLSESELLSRLSKSKNRNSQILDTILKEVKNNQSKIIVFACDIEHARNLAFSLCCLGIRAASIDSKYTTLTDKSRIIRQYREGDLNVLVNCEMLTTGFDAPETNVAVIARPTESLVLYLQMIGRALRGKKDRSSKTARIYTVIDQISEFNNVNIAFKHWNHLWTELKTSKEA